MLTLAPVPRWAEFFRLVVPTCSSLQKFSHIWTNDSGGVSGWLSRSSWSLALIAAWRRESKGSESVSLWIPDYFCNESLFFLREMGVHLHFYPIMEDLTPNYSIIRTLAKKGQPDIFLLVHYFGQPIPTPAARDFCKHAKAWLVEDATHVLLPGKGVGSAGDFVVYSPHKIFAAPDGALLIARTKGVSGLDDVFMRGLGDPNNWASQARGILPTVTLNRNSTGWLIKRALQRFGFVRSAIRLPNTDSASQHSVSPPVISWLGRKLLSIQLRSVSIRSARIRNKLLLDYLISKSELSADLKPVVGKAFETLAPYYAQYEIISDGDIVQKSRKRGLLAITWPDLPPEVELNPWLHSQAIKLKDSTLFLPIHQSLSFGDFPKIFSQDQPILNNLFLKDWSGTDEDWNSAVKQVGFSNLLQSWEYGEAKRRVNGWNISRFSITNGRENLGIVQVLERRLLGLIRVYRINRGPIFFIGTSAESRSAANHLVRRTFGKFWLGKILFWAPELTLQGENLALCFSIGFRERAINSWSSSVIDLSQTEERLQMRFSGKWRSMLRVAQAEHNCVRNSNDKHEFALFAARCAQMLDERCVKSHVKLTLQLRELLSHKPKRDLFLVAYQDDRAIAAIYIVVHGSTATYLLGWNGPEGRVVCAHHLLLWEAVRQLKAMSILHFDLGGIDREDTPGIAAFKLGMGGEEYELIGEGICY